ncbi:MAG: hypothetical protein LBS11_01465 [Oscillospiraceae bacterium]|jgi:beta-glucosidase|nr:hypothetical protein [Oscillospiraceae bacterium]
MKRVSWFLIAVLALSFAGVQVNAESTVAQADIEARVKPIIEADGLRFKDLNGNGELDAYEDWRADIEERIADLLSQMTLEEEVGLLFCNNTSGQFSGTYPVTYNYLYNPEPYEPGLDEPNGSGYSAQYYINEFLVSCFLDNANGTPEEQVFVHNEIQKMSEATRLGIPMTFTSDREYNSWGGFVDKPHAAFGAANDPELAVKLLERYAQSMKSVGVHVTFEPYGNEIGSFNGEDPEYIAQMSYLEVKTLEENGLASCVKHWIGRGGDSSFGNARSVAQNLDNWLEGWKAAIDAGAEWVMTNSGGTGINNTVSIDYDIETMAYLRETLGFDGVVVTDWWALGMGAHVTGVTAEGVDLAQQNGRQLYKLMLEAGVDVFGTTISLRGEDIDSAIMANYPDCIINGVKEGEIDKALVDRAATRVLRFKFNKGLFENPYVDAEAAIALGANDSYTGTPINSFEEYTNAPRGITTNEDLKAARNPIDVELGEAMQASSAVLVKNDGGLLPLDKGISVYVEASSKSLAEHYAQYIAGYATVVDAMEDADVVVGDFSAINDVAELFIDDAADLGKPIVLTLNGVKPDAYAIESADALLYLTFNQQADHGSQLPGFITTTEPWVYADLLFGEKEPTGMIVKEIARDSFNDASQWKDLAGDQGASAYVRLIVQALMEDDPNHASPNNYGDPLITYKYGMRYGAEPEFEYSCLILPVSQAEVTETNSWGSESTSVRNVVTAKAGETFPVYALLRNNGGDGLTNVQVFDGDTLAAEKIVAVNGGSWRVVEIDVTISEPGERAISLGGQTGTITIE